MKLFVDNMPSKPQQCLFANRLYSDGWRCMFTHKVCENTDKCRYLKTNHGSSFLDKKFHINEKEEIEFNTKCPKCGEDNTNVNQNGNSFASLYFVECSDCGFSTEYYATREDAIGAWNELHKGIEEFGSTSDVYTPYDYQTAAGRTMDHMLSTNGRLLEGLVGINSEAGEALDIWKKYEFHKHDLDKKAIAMELGDVLWYLTEAAGALGYHLEDIMKMNIEKLSKRYPDGFDPERSKNREE